MTAHPEESGPDAGNRGRPARVAPNGEVRGSGSGTGGGGSPEDIDDDSVSGGGGDVEPSTPPPASVGGDASNHGSR